MPTYSYACTECDNRFDAVQSFTDDSLTVCPQCQGKLRKIFSSVGVVFKGSGFYRTDSRSGNTGSDAAKPAKTEGASDAKPAAQSEGKSEGKSATAAEVEKATSSAGS